ncbi:hypothetical protein BC833DRAFT_565207 [Globomyces pollinis-pini]|nr:hypothetical protein BC833DRAFT_565207 [Globomyces pollinis-pini]
MQRFKEKFNELHDFLLTLNGFEKGMVEHLRSTLQDMTIQRLDKDRAISQQFSGNAEIGELKRELLKAQNEVDVAIERESKLQLDIEEMTKTKQDLIHDIEEIRRHKADMLEPQLIAATKELKMDLLQRRNQLENLQKDMEEKQSSYEVVLLDRDRAEAEREKHSILLAKASETPIKLIKQSDVLKDAIASLTAEHSKQTTICQSLEKEIDRLAKKKKEFEELRISQSAAYEERRGLINQMERQVDDIFKEHELAKEQLASQKAERVRLDLGLRKMVHEIKREHDLVLRVIREKDTYLKLYRRLELTVNNIKLSTPTTVKQGDGFRRLLEAHKSDEKFYRKEVARLKQQIDIRTFEFLKQEKLEKSEADALLEQTQANRKIDTELEASRREAILSSRVLEEIKMEKDLRSREVIRSQGRLRAIKNDIGTKQIANLDASKRCTETLNRVKEFMTLYELVKNERNKYKKHQANSAEYAKRDALRNEANKLLLQYREKRDQIDHRLTRIEALNHTINMAEEEMMVLKARYEQSVKDRNIAGVHLLDRNDELCILYERINVQKEIMAKGTTALNEREEEIRKYELILTELKRKLELQKQKSPQLVQLEQEITKLEDEERHLQEIMVLLGQSMENPEDSKRCRNLGGTDPTQEQLAKKIEKLEVLLSVQEEKILEKELIYEEITALCDRLKVQTEESKDESYSITKEINDLTKRIKNVTRKTMAKVSELAMHQAQAMSLYREKVEKECLLEESQCRLETGDIPLEQIEADFIREERVRIQKKARLQAKYNKDEQGVNGRFIEIQDEFYIHGQVRTTAEPRPNAYIPETTGLGQLPIPKPYGEHSPFKPREPGAQLRHYRKPIERPIEI